MNLSKKEIFAFNTGLGQAQWQITKAMMALDLHGNAGKEIKTILKFIHDEIEKEKNEYQKMRRKL